MTLGQRVRQLRERAKLTQEQLGQMVGLSKTHISDLENDKRDDPGGKGIKRVANVLGVTADYLLSDLAIEVGESGSTAVNHPVGRRNADSTIDVSDVGGLIRLAEGYPVPVDSYRLGMTREAGFVSRRTLDMDKPGVYTRVVIEDDRLAPTVRRADRLIFLQELWPSGADDLALLELERRLVLCQASPRDAEQWAFMPVIPRGHEVTMKLPDPRFLGALLMLERRNVRLGVPALPPKRER